MKKRSVAGHNCQYCIWMIIAQLNLLLLNFSVKMQRIALLNEVPVIAWRGILIKYFFLLLRLNFSQGSRFIVPALLLPGLFVSVFCLINIKNPVPASWWELLNRFRLFCQLYDLEVCLYRKNVYVEGEKLEGGRNQFCLLTFRRGKWVFVLFPASILPEVLKASHPLGLYLIASLLLFWEG